MSSLLSQSSDYIQEEEDRGTEVSQPVRSDSIMEEDEIDRVCRLIHVLKKQVGGSTFSMQ